jgi:hypothetical protein
MTTDYVTKCPGCEMPLTAEQASEPHCYNCRRPLKETIGGFIPRRCNQCGAVIPTDSGKCRNCGGNPGGPALAGYSEAVARGIPPAYARRLREGLWDGSTPAGWHLSEPYMPDEMADFIIERAIAAIFVNLDAYTVAQAFGMGITFELSAAERQKARDFVRRIFSVH